MKEHEVEVKNPFFAAIASMCDYELRPRNTVTFLSEVDLTQMEEVRANHGSGRKPSYTAFVVQAAARALCDFPEANRRVCGGLLGGLRLQRFHAADVAVACERNVPEAPMATFIDVLRSADALSLAEITERLHDLAICDQTTNRQWAEFHWIVTRLPRWLARWIIRLPILFPGLWVKYRGGAVLVSAPAKYGVDVVAATWPWALGISFGLVKPRPLVRDGKVVARPTFTLTLNFDRRVMAGAQAARFFKRIVDLLEHAETKLTADPTGDEDAWSKLVEPDGDNLEKALNARSHSEFSK